MMKSTVSTLLFLLKDYSSKLVQKGRVIGETGILEKVWGLTFAADDV